MSKNLKNVQDAENANNVYVSDVKNVKKKINLEQYSPFHTLHMSTLCQQSSQI